jgi:hypothetical protein
MKHTQYLATTILLASLAMCARSRAQGTAFTYQGRLNDGVSPAAGIYDLRFTVYNAPTNGSAVSGIVTNASTSVSNGLFAVTLDFGNVFPGAERWLEIGVRTNGGGAFAPLTPRQKLTATPYAITAGNVTGTLAAGALSGTYSNAVTFSNTANQFTGTFAGNGGALSNVNAATLGGLGANQFWKTAGNAGTTPGINFLGTTDGAPLELFTGNQRALRLEPNTNGAPNVIAGAAVNQVDAGVVGAIISGGGATNYFGFAYPNRVSANYSAVGGGAGNTVRGEFSAISSGGGNTIQTNGNYSVIGGGTANTIQTNGSYSVIGGGLFNTIQPNAGLSAIGGGYGNVINEGVYYASIGGGLFNTNAAGVSVIGGGQNNTIQPFGDMSVIGGGWLNLIQSGADQSVIAGGNANLIQGGARESFIGGGFANAIQTNAGGSFIGGGILNTNGPGVSFGTIGGGVGGLNIGYAATIAGGYYNTVTSNSAAIGGGGFNFASGINSVVPGGSYNRNAGNNAAIGGGEGNAISNNAPHAAIAGGVGNQSDAGASFIGGGSYNVIHGPGAVIGGGFVNRAENFDAVIGGGAFNVNAGYRSFIGSGEGNVISNSGSYATIGGGYANAISGTVSVIGGGAFNTGRAGANYAVIGGGEGNAIQETNVWPTIGGGRLNSIYSNNFSATIAGGEKNVVQLFSSFSFIGGGLLNIADGEYTSLGGGLQNRIGGDWGTVPGGRDNAADGNYSFAAGRRAKANHQGTFVWADSQDTNFTSTASNQFLIRASGGVGIGVTNPASALHVAGTITAANFSGSPSALSGTFTNPITFNPSAGAPFAVGSATKVTNLNADLLDGLDSTAFWKTTGNSGTSPGVNSLGTTDNQPLEIKVNGGRALRLEPTASGSPNIIAGSAVNSISPGVSGAAIGGGLDNTINAGSTYAKIGGGQINAIGKDSYESTIGGGYRNTIETYDSTIGGGAVNTIQTNSGYSTIAGGVNNRIFSGALLSTIGGGSGNLIGSNAQYSTIPGGVLNTAGGQSSFAAGYRAKAMHQGSFVWADSQEADFASSASNQFLIRASGGAWINSTNPSAALRVGDTNIPDSQGIIRLASRSGTGPANRYWDIGVPEGNEDVGGKFYSFVIDDPQTGTAPELVIRWDSGYVGMGTMNPASRLHAVADSANAIQGDSIDGHGVNGISANANGVQGNSSSRFASGVYGENTSGDGYGIAGRASFIGKAVFGENSSPFGYAGYFIGNVQVDGTVCANNIACPSDRNVKSGFESVDSKAILEKVAALSITRWRYTNDTATPHVGPVAQDFYAAFGVGSDDKHISTVDADGVALAAIQGLNQKLTEELKRRDAENAELKQRLDTLEKTILLQKSN